MAGADMGAGIGGSVGSLLGSIIGEIWASGDEDEAKAKMDEAQRLIDQLDIPDVSKFRLATSIMEGPSAMEQIKSDPALAGIQKEALSTYQKQAQGVGLDAQGKNAMYQGQVAAGQAAAARQGAIKQDMRARGIRGSGLDLASQMIAAQGEAGQNAQLGYQAMSDSEARRTQATDKSAALAGQMSNQQFQQDATRAQGADQRVAQRQAQGNFGAEQYNGLIGDQYQRQVQKAQLQQQSRQQQQQYYQNRADRKRSIATDAGNVAGTAAGFFLGGA